MSEWISVKDKVPLLFTRVLVTCGANVAIGYLTSMATWSDDNAKVGWQPTHWQPLPAPPPQQSSFDKWWGDRGYICMELPNGRCWVHRKAAQGIWDAAIAASKSPDFVP